MVLAIRRCDVDITSAVPSIRSYFWLKEFSRPVSVAIRELGAGFLRGLMFVSRMVTRPPKIRGAACKTYGGSDIFSM